MDNQAIEEQLIAAGFTRCEMESGRPYFKLHFLPQVRAAVLFVQPHDNGTWEVLADDGTLKDHFIGDGYTTSREILDAAVAFINTIIAQLQTVTARMEVSDG